MPACWNTRAGLFQSTQTMSVYEPNPQTAVESNEKKPTITGPYMEPPEISNATTYWHCSACGRESIHKQDTQCPAFHAEDCAEREESG